VQTPTNSLVPFRGRQGFTLIEMTLVITLMLAMIGIITFGVSAWREGANRSTCIMQQSTVQKAMRSHVNMNDMNTGDTIAQADVVGTGRLIETAPVCRSSGTYTYGSTVPASGTRWMTCSRTNHAPTNTTGW